jgi:N-acyl-D-aspartate/D-glutamate deacylase
MQADLVIRNGLVMDGTGAAAREADIALAGDHIVEVGEVRERGREEIDASGLLVTPGFVDIHTHYDAQAIWDSHMAPSAWHGVTTAVMGNCGVGFAPCKPGDRQKLVELMEGVEDIPGACLHEGLDWQWESFPDYLAALERRPRDIDLGALLPHAAVRVFVMGERALALEPADASDIARMQAITADAVKAGAFGVSTSRTISHKTLAGDYTPTLRALEAELTGLAHGVAEGGRGFLELVSDWNQPDGPGEFAMMRRIHEASGTPIVFSMSARHDRTEIWKDLLALSDQAAAEGKSIRPVFPPRPIGILLGLQGTQNPFSGCPSYRAIAHLPLAERVAAMRDPGLRARILAEDPVKDSVFPLMHRIGYARMFLFEDPPNYAPAKEQNIEAIAAREGRTAPEVAYDMLLGDEGRNFIFTALTNYADYTLDPSEECLRHPNAIMGLSDGGAHVGFISDGSFPSYLLAYWGRGKGFALEDLVRRLTSDTARAAGLDDRGVLAPGKLADVNLIDFDRLALRRPTVAKDLPAGGMRLLQRADGYVATIKSGTVTYRDGAATGALPGRLLRSPA